MKRKILSILLALVLLLGLPVTAYAADTATCETLKHDYDDGVCTICGHSVLGTTWLEPDFPEGDYTIVALPDPQWVVEYHPQVFYDMIQWIVDNKETMNIRGVLGLGDMTDDNTTTQWEINKKGMDMLTEAGIPWMPSQGNHDSWRNYSHKTDYFNEYFDYESYGPDQPWFGGSFHEDLLDHTYWFITAGEREYLVFSMGWAPSWDAIDWMEEIIKENPDKNVIYTAHAYMYSNNKPIVASNGGSVTSYGSQYAGYPEGQDIYNILRKYDNFVLGIGGHIMYADLSVYVGTNGRGADVYNLLMDAQDKDTKTSVYAMLGLYTFREKSDSVQVSWYSTWFDALYKAKNQITIQVPHVHVHNYVPKVFPANCLREGYTRYMCDVCHDTYRTDYTGALGDHAPGTPVIENRVEATETVPGSYDSVVYCTTSGCGKELSRETVTIAPEQAVVTRIYGNNRSATAIAAANVLKQQLGVQGFDYMILASGTNFADALAGSYLAAEKNAPILLHTKSTAEGNLDYITANLAEGGTVYILGGTSAVPKTVADDLTAEGITVKRLYGDNRFATNIAILQEAGVAPGTELLVCTGHNFADSLSASATGLPILLVDSKKDALTADQQAYLESLNGTPMTIIGGVGAVSEQLETALGAYGKADRVFGDNRYATSAAIAERYFEDVDTAVIAYGKNFPDGLCGGPLAYMNKAPMLLTEAGQEAVAAAYVDEHDVWRGYVMGGVGVISDETVTAIFG